MISAFLRGIKRRFTEDPEETTVQISNKSKLMNPISNDSSPAFLAPVVDSDAAVVDGEERSIKPLRTIVIPVEKIESTEEAVVVNEEETPKAVEESVGVEVESNRTPGIDPFTIKSTLKDMYEQGILEDVDEEDQQFPYNAEFNDKVIIWRGDITALSVDVIVNAANRALLGGGGVDGAIHRAAGRGLYEECIPLNGAETGESKITSGHDLPALKVIHTVGPIYSKNKKKQSELLLRSCYESTFKLAVENNCKTIALSGISTGVYGYPLDDATRVALDVTRNFLASPEGSNLEKVIFTVFRQIDVDSYHFIAPEYFPPAPSAEVKDVAGSETAEASVEDEKVVADTAGLDLEGKVEA